MILGTIAASNLAGDPPPLFLSIISTDLPSACPPIPSISALVARGMTSRSFSLTKFSSRSVAVEALSNAVSAPL